MGNIRPSTLPWIWSKGRAFRFTLTIHIDLDMDQFPVTSNPFTPIHLLPYTVHNLTGRWWEFCSFTSCLSKALKTNCESLICISSNWDLNFVRTINWRTCVRFLRRAYGPDILVWKSNRRRTCTKLSNSFPLWFRIFERKKKEMA